MNIKEARRKASQLGLATAQVLTAKGVPYMCIPVLSHAHAVELQKQSIEAAEAYDAMIIQEDNNGKA